jgi:hypothetical protein
MPIGLFIHPALPLIDLAFRPILTAAKRFERTAHESGRREPRGSRPPTPPDVLIVSGGFL